MSDKEVLEKASKAERLLADPLLTESFDAIRMAILDKIEAAPVRDRDGVHELKLMLKLLRDVRGNLEQAVRDGKFVTLRTRSEDEEKKRRFFNFR